MPADDPLWEVNLIPTPHCSAARQTRDRLGHHPRESRHVAGEPLENICDKRAGF